MKKLLAAACLAGLIAISGAVRAEDISRFLPLKADELTPAQKAYADLIAAPPRNAKFVNPPEISRYRQWLAQEAAGRTAQCSARAASTCRNGRPRPTQDVDRASVP